MTTPRLLELLRQEDALLAGGLERNRLPILDVDLDGGI